MVALLWLASSLGNHKVIKSRYFLRYMATTEVNQFSKSLSYKPNVRNTRPQKERRPLRGESYSGLIEGPSCRLGSS